MQEKIYLDQLFEEKGWFMSENFDVFVPKNRDSIEEEMPSKGNLLSKNISWLRSEWKKKEKDYFGIIKKFHHAKLLSRYKCHVSRFGPEGKYMRPCMLFIRLRTKRDKTRVIETIGHELLHLVFSDFLEFKKLGYPEREGMIDALILQSNLSKLFPRYKKQSIGKVRQKLLKTILK